jgi:hypothetical protein
VSKRFDIRSLLFSSPEYWGIIADNLSEAGWSWGCLSTIDSNGRTIFVVDAHRDENQRFIVRADEKLAGFVELESAIHRAIATTIGQAHMSCQQRYF